MVSFLISDIIAASMQIQDVLVAPSNILQEYEQDPDIIF